MHAWEKLASESSMKPEVVRKTLAAFEIETPSWGYANTGTRFGKFLQASAAVTLEHKIQDAAEVHRLTGVAPRMAVHVLWDFPDGFDAKVVKLAQEHGLRIGAINPNVFQDQCYKLGSFCNPEAKVRRRAIRHCLDSVEIGRQTKSGILSLWFADGTNYPGQDDIVRRKHHMAEGLAEVYAAMPDFMTMLIEYKPFEPAAYHTDIPDWGTAALLARACGDRAKVLVDTGHHLQGTNVEQIVAILLDEGLLGGFHFNDRKSADDDLTAGSIAPYQLFLIFDQIVAARARGTGPRPTESACSAPTRGARSAGIATMIDQSHNLKPKVEAMVQTVVNIQTLYAKALLVNREKLAKAQAAGDIVDSEECLRRAFFTDVEPLLTQVREQMGVPADPLSALRESGYIEKCAVERKADAGDGTHYA
ncbi:MAG TPA: TIM barrel protein [Planctomycetota bacterium]|nr:TIM barrel protein [Planctomycetota bacterium]